MLLIKRILILEDNYKVLSTILEKLSELENRQPFEFSITIINDSEQVENLINGNPRAKFDIILLDRDCKINKSFHVLDIEHFEAEKVIAISSIPKFNQQAKDRGVTKVIEKDILNVNMFVDKIIREIESAISKMPWGLRKF